MKMLKILKSNSKYVITYLLVVGLVTMGVRLLQDRSWFLGLFFLVSSGLIIYVYSVSKKVPSKYLLPGVLLLALFQIYPAFYSGYVAFTNDSNGHQISKAQAIEAIIQDSKIPADDQLPIDYVVAQKLSSKTIYLIFQYPESIFYAGNSSSLQPLSPSEITFTEVGTIEKIKGFRILSALQSEELSSELQGIQVQLKNGITFQPQDLETLEAYRPSFVYSEAKDTLTNILSGVTYMPDDNGQMVGTDGEVLYPGWKVNVGWRNFSSVISDQAIRRPLTAVLVWTFFNAILLVFLSFLMGLTLALIFNSPHLHSKRIYRTIFIIPMAIPSVLSILVWHGLFTTETGVIDRLFNISTPWLTEPLPARIAVLIVELWITFPYMFLITTGAIQAIPSEILEAAEIDGASPIKSFRLIKLPLVFRTLAPLLIASGAMALNNFGVIYLLTGGGPTFSNSNGNAGATDILISYTYKLAFNSQEGNNYGLASALSILNFILVGFMSVYGLRRIKTMEGVN